MEISLFPLDLTTIGKKIIFNLMNLKLVQGLKYREGIKSRPVSDFFIPVLHECKSSELESFMISCLPMITHVPHTTVRRKMDDPANKPTPVEAYSCALSLSLEIPVTENKQATTRKIIRISYVHNSNFLLLSTKILMEHR